MDQFTGECVDGPLDGNMLAHWSQTYALFRLVNGKSCEVGEYRLDGRRWIWRRSALAAFEEPVSR